MHKKKNQTSEHSEQVTFQMHSTRWIKIIQALSMVYYFYFIYTQVSLLTNTF